MARKSKNTCLLSLITLIGVIAFIFVIIMTDFQKSTGNEKFTNFKEKFNNQTQQNTCGTCRVRNQG